MSCCFGLTLCLETFATVSSHRSFHHTSPPRREPLVRGYTFCSNTFCLRGRLPTSSIAAMSEKRRSRRDSNETKYLLPENIFSFSLFFLHNYRCEFGREASVPLPSFLTDQKAEMRIIFQAKGTCYSFFLHHQTDDTNMVLKMC